MRATRAALALAVATGLTALVPASATGATTADRAPKTKAWVKTVCRDDGKTRVRIRAQVPKGEPLFDLSWKIDDGDTMAMDVLIEGAPTVETLHAFTIRRGSRAQISVGEVNDQGTTDPLAAKTVRGRRC